LLLDIQRVVLRKENNTREMVPRKRGASASPPPAEDGPSTPRNRRGRLPHAAAAVVPPTTPTVTPAAKRSAIPIASGEPRRSLFPDATSAVAITPSKDTPAKDGQVRRKLIFGRPVVEVALKDSVKHVYGIVKKLTGSIGGNGSFGPIYGELTAGSMQKMINLMKEHTGFDATSRFMDVGSGIGKPNLHVAQDPGVEFSYGIEVEADRWLLGMNCLKGVLDAAIAQPPTLSADEKILTNCIFVHGDIRSAQTFDPFTHVYMFSIGFPPALWYDLSEIWNRSMSQFLICYHGPRDIIYAYEFDVELVVQTPTSMHGSKEGHMGYIYKRAERSVVASSTICDPFFEPALNLVRRGFDAFKKDVDEKVEARMKSGTSTRSRRQQL
jgi:Histone methylation protein DOT1